MHNEDDNEQSLVRRLISIAMVSMLLATGVMLFVPLPAFAETNPPHDDGSGNGDDFAGDGIWATDGDWTIESMESRMFASSGDVIIVNGNLTVGGSMTLEGVTLSMNYAPGTGIIPTIRIDSGGTFLALDDAIITSQAGNSDGYHFKALSGSSLTLSDTIMERMATRTGSEASGLEIYTTNASILNTTIRNGYGNGMYIAADVGLLDNVTVENNFRRGVYVDGSYGGRAHMEGCNITGNTIYGVYLYLSDGNKIKNSTIGGNGGSALYIDQSDGNIIANNTIENVTSAPFWYVFILSGDFNMIEYNDILGSGLGTGILTANGGTENGFGRNHFEALAIGILMYDSGTSVTNNTFVDVYRGVYVRGMGNFFEANTISLKSESTFYGFEISGSNFENTITTSNSVDGQSVYYIHGSHIPTTLEDLSLTASRVINLGQISIIDSSNITLKNITVSSFNSDGIFLKGVSNTSLENISVSGSMDGIHMESSQDIVVRNSSAVSNDAGVRLEECNRVTVTGGTFTGNDYGIYLQQSDSNTFESGNTISSNNIDGIRLEQSGGNSIVENSVSYNFGEGIYLGGSNYNTLSLNTVTENGNSGIHLNGTGGSNYNLLSGNIISDNNDAGIKIYDSKENVLHENAITSGIAWGIHVDVQFDNAISTNNTVDGEAVHYYYGKNGGAVSGISLEKFNTVYPGKLVCVECVNVAFDANYIVNNSMGSGVFVVDSSSMNISGNTLGGSLDSVISIHGSSDVSVEGNSISTPGIGIRIMSSARVHLTDNEIYGFGSGTGIFSEESEFEASENDISALRCGIYFRFGSVAYIHNNTVFDILNPGVASEYHAIRGIDTSTALIEHNTITNITRNAIYINNLQADIKHNIITNVGDATLLENNIFSWAILLDSIATSTIEGNSIENSIVGIGAHLGSTSEIVNNTLSDCKRVGIQITGEGTTSHVAGNLIENTSGLWDYENDMPQWFLSGYGIDIGGGASAVIEHNTITGSNFSGINVRAYGNLGTSPTIRNNTITTTKLGLYGVREFGSGIKAITGLVNPTIENNTILESGVGIWVLQGANAAIRDNVLDSNSYYGIFLNGSSDGAKATITDNVVSNSQAGIFLKGGSESVISGNRVHNNTDGFRLESSSNATLSENAARDNQNGIFLEGSGNSSLSGNDAEYNAYGLYMDSAKGYAIFGLNAHDNSQAGIYAIGAGTATIVGGDVWNNPKGMFLDGATEYTAIGLNARNNTYEGVFLLDASGNVIQKGELSGNYHGLYMHLDSINNTIRENEIKGNSVGIKLTSKPLYNYFCHNNFNNQITNAQGSGTVNYWDCGYPTGGNWWSDLSGNTKYYVDDYQGINDGGGQEDPGSDYINDYVYKNGNVQDSYPFWYENGWRPVHNLDTHVYYDKIQPAVDGALAGHTIVVSSGTYSENVYIDKALTLAGAGRETTIIDGGGSDSAVVRIENATNATLTGFSLRDGKYGVHAYSVDSVVISGNGVYDCHDMGVYIEDADSAAVFGNNISRNDYGLYLKGVSNSSIANNIIREGDAMGISLYSSVDNLFRDNIVEMEFYGISLASLSNGNEFWNDSATVNTVGVRIIGSHYNLFHNVSVKSGSNDAVYLLGAQHNTIRSSNLESNGRYGVALAGTSHFTNILDTRVVSNAGNGIHMASDYNNIVDSYINSNSQNGIYLLSTANSNTISGSTISQNTLAGLYIAGSGNTVYENNITGNDYGVELSITSTGNIVYHNNFDNTAYNANDTGTDNLWHNATLGTGNWWSDYDAAHLGGHGAADGMQGAKSVFNESQPDSGADGVLDWSYDLDGAGYDAGDWYPLASEYSW